MNRARRTGLGTIQTSSWLAHYDGACMGPVA
jgi:hypothetical protein